MLIASVLLACAGVCSAHDDDFVQFEIQPTGRTPHQAGQTEWLATYKGQSATAKFIVALDTNALSPDAGIAFAKGAIVHVSGSDPRNS